jgi:hypothetical protein
MKKYNLHDIMTAAWVIFRKAAGKFNFAEALHRAWLSAKAEPLNAARIEAAKAATGIAEQVETWSGWKKLGYEVIALLSASRSCCRKIWFSAPLIEYPL